VSTVGSRREYSDGLGRQATYQRLRSCLAVMFWLAAACDVWAGEQIVAIQPSAGQTVGSSQPEMIIDFSGPIDPNTATTDSVRIYAIGSAEPTPGSDDTPVVVGSIIPEASDTRLAVTPQDPLPDGDYAWVVYGSAPGRSGPGYGLYFNDHVAYFDEEAFKTLADEFTLEAWVRFDDWSSYGSHTYGAVFDIGQTGRYVPGFRLGHERADMRFYFRKLDGTEAWCVATNALAKGEWRHLAAVSSPDGLKVYVGGELAAEIPDSFRPIDFAANIEVALTGYTRWAGAYDWVLGFFDEMRVWNVARTRQQIGSAMYTPLVGDEPGLLIYHPLDQTAGTVLIDVTGHGYDGYRNDAERQPSEAPLIEMASVALTGADTVPVDVDGDGWRGGVLVSTFTVDTSGPRVTALEPDLTLGLVPQVCQQIALTFDDQMDPNTLVPAHVEVLASGDGILDNGNDSPVPVSAVTYDPNTGIATVDFSSALATDLYRLTLSDLVENAVAIALDGEYPGPGGLGDPLPSGDGSPGGDLVIEFDVDTPPQVVAMDPLPGSRRNDVTAVTVGFSEPIDPNTPTPETFLLIGDGPDDQLGTGDDVPIVPDGNTITVEPDGMQASFGVSGGLASDTYHVVLVSEESISDAFESIPDLNLWQLNGSAVWEEADQRLTLAPAASGTVGSLVWTRRVLIDSCVVEFDFLVDGGSDGLTCFFWNHDSPQILGNSGESLGLDGAPGSGYAVEFDTYQNSGGFDPSGNHVALITRPRATPLAWYDVLTDFVTTFELWHVTVNWDHGHVQVYLRNDQLAFPETLVIDHVIAGFSPYWGYIGFSAANGGGAALHAIDNVTITAPALDQVVIRDVAGVPLDGEFQGGFPSGDGIAGGSFFASFEADTTPPTVIDTDPDDGDSDNSAGRFEVQLTFSEAMDALSVQNVAAYSVVRNGHHAVLVQQATYDSPGKRVTLQLNGGQPLSDGSYTVTVDGDLLTDEAGNALDGDVDGQPGGAFSFYFVRDTQCPQVVTTDPAPGSSTNDPEIWLLEVFFDSPVDPVAAEDVHAYLLTGSGGDDDFVSGNEYYVAINDAWYDPQGDSVLLLVNYAVGLGADLYRLTVYSDLGYGIVDLAGNALDGDGDGDPGPDYVADFRIATTLPGDLDLDCDVDVADYQLFAEAFSGSGVPTSDPLADLDFDEDCDLEDLALFVEGFTGPGPGCP